MDSRTAWAVVGGLAVTVTGTGADILNTVPESSLVPKELWGVTDRIQGIIIQLSDHPDSFTRNPTGAHAQH